MTRLVLEKQFVVGTKMAQQENLTGALDGKTALVTGSTSGLGLAIAMGLREAGATTLFHGRRSETDFRSDLEDADVEIAGEVPYVRADISSESGCRALADEVTATWDGVDILVNNAGNQHVSSIEEFDSSKWTEILSTHLTAAFLLSKSFLPRMKRNGWGRIVNMGSAHSLIASPYKSAYVSAKHGLLGLTKVTALETATHGVTCNIICPGYVETPLVRKQIEDKARDSGDPMDLVKSRDFLGVHPTGEFVRPGEITACILYLCSEFSNGITGTNITIDGGWTAR